MFLFEGPSGRMLHTGDFRWEAEHLADMLHHPALTSAAIDTLFLDNTYAHPRHCAFSSLFPSRAICNLFFLHASPTAAPAAMPHSIGPSPALLPALDASVLPAQWSLSAASMP